jgi:hypothetical protein
VQGMDLPDEDLQKTDCPSKNKIQIGCLLKKKKKLKYFPISMVQQLFLGNIQGFCSLLKHCLSFVIF